MRQKPKLDPNLRRNALLTRNATPLAQKLRGRRVDRRMTQAQLAKAVGLSVGTVSRAERGVMTAHTVRLIRQELQRLDNVTNFVTPRK